MTTEPLLKIESFFHQLTINLENEACVRECLTKITEICPFIGDEEGKSEIPGIVSEIEAALSNPNRDLRNDAIFNLCQKAKQRIYQTSFTLIESFNHQLKQTMIEDFYIIGHDGCNLTIAGSFDFSYYHNVELTFMEVEFISCPNHFEVDNFRIATNQELQELNKYMYGYEKAGFAVCLESTFTKDKYFIVAHGVKVNWGMVYYYKKEDLKPGERIANWVFKNS